MTRERILDASLVVVCGIGQAAAAVLAAFATRDAFSALHGGASIPVRTVVELGAAGLVAGLCLFFAQRRSEALGHSYAISLRRCIYRHIAALPKSCHQERRIGALALRFVGDLSAARLWFGGGLSDALTALVVLPAGITLLFALDSDLAAVGVGPLGVTLLLAAAWAWHLERNHRSLRRRRAGLAIGMIERIAISPELDLMGRTSKEVKLMKKRGTAIQSDAVARRSRTAALQAVLQIGSAVSGLTVLWQAGVTGAAPATVAASLAVLALLTVPLLNLATAWDRYCAWQVAREKALNLLREKTVRRTIEPRHKPVDVEISGWIDGVDVSLKFAKSQMSVLEIENASSLARNIAGLDQHQTLIVLYNGKATLPKLAYLGDWYVGIQGSLRRSATLLSAKRPSDVVVTEALEAYGLEHLVTDNPGLDRRIAEGGRNLSTADTLRLDLVRAELGKVELLIVDSVRWQADVEKWHLIEVFKSRCNATILISNAPVNPIEQAA